MAAREASNGKQGVAKQQYAGPNGGSMSRLRLLRGITRLKGEYVTLVNCSDATLLSQLQPDLVPLPIAESSPSGRLDTRVLRRALSP